jgi:uroporphyrinogen-III decarboxylase
LEKDVGLLMKWEKSPALGGLDFTPRNARYLSGGNITLQGNFDPSRLLSPIPVIKW